MTTSTIPNNSGIYEDARNMMNKFIDSLESEQSKVNKAFFESLTMEQRDKFCQSLANQDIKTSKIEKITGRSQPTINRHLNGKNS